MRLRLETTSMDVGSSITISSVSACICRYWRKVWTQMRKRMAMAQTQSKIPFPTEVFPLGVKFRVEVVDSIDGDDEAFGETAGDLRQIRITSDQDTRRRWTTLLHEYLHATLHVVGVANEMDIQLEEVIVQSLEHSLEQFLILNGEAFIRALEVQK